MKKVTCPIICNFFTTNELIMPEEKNAQRIGEFKINKFLLKKLFRFLCRKKLCNEAHGWHYDRKPYFWDFRS